MPKSPDAFRTISEVADWLGVQAHVLRFWESKFTQVKPIKRAGGRRYYRPADMLLLGGIKKLLHDDGMTIKGAQKILREQGVSYVSDFSQALDDLTMAVLEGAALPDAETGPRELGRKDEEIKTAALDGEIMDDEDSEWDASEIPEKMRTGADDEEADEELAAEYAARRAEDDDADAPAQVAAAPVAPRRDGKAEQVELDFAGPGDAPAPPAPGAEVEAEPGPELEAEPELEPEPETEVEAVPEPEQEENLPDFLRKPLNEVADADPVTPEEPSPYEIDAVSDTPSESPQTAGPDMVMPTFSARSRRSAAPTEAAEIPEAAAPKKPRVIDLPPLPDLADLPASPAALSALARKPKFDTEQAHALRPLLARLIRHRASLSSPRKDVRKD